jgi:hypothetical protein
MRLLKQCLTPTSQTWLSVQLSVVTYYSGILVLELTLHRRVVLHLMLINTPYIA